MTDFASAARQREGRLWAIAFGVSILGNLLILAFAAVIAISSEKFYKEVRQAAETPEKPASVLISPEMIQKVTENAASSTTAAAAPQPLARTAAPDFTRTSEDQTGKRPDRPVFIGERNTEATSDAAPDPNAPAMPSQRGIEPRDSSDIETTESRYQDGALDGPATPSESTPPQAASSAGSPGQQPDASPQPPTEASNDQTASDSENPDTEEMKKSTGPEDLVQGTSSVDVEVAKPTPEKTLPPAPTPQTPSESSQPAPDEQNPAPANPASKPAESGFRGHQRKTAIQGSISRTGRSSLDVADTPLGRYQAAISRAVEREWQLNCLQYRDFITPGFLTVRFFVLPTGKVKSVQFIGQMETSQQQKGFTLSSIRDAPIPPMPKEIRSEYSEDPLELIFNFYF